MILFCYVTWNSIPERNARANKLRTILVANYYDVSRFDEGLVQLNELNPRRGR